MAASASLLGRVGAGSDSKGGGRDGRRRRRKEIDRKVMKNECRDKDHLNNFLQSVSVKERNKGGKRCKMMTTYEERVYNPWPLDKEEAVASLVRKRVSKSRNAKMMTIFEDSNIGSGDLGRMDVRLDVLFEQSDKGTMDGKYNARAFIDELLKETDDLYWICSAIIDEMDREKEMHEKLSAEIQKCEQPDTIWVMMGAIKVDNFDAIETITGKDYDNELYNGEEEEEKYNDEIHIKDYLNSLSCEELKEKDARDAKLWERCNKDNDVG